MKKKTLIIGGGLAGLATSYFLAKKGIEAPVFEKEKECGGLCRSIKKHGFTFDFSGHLLHFRRKDTFLLVRNLLEGRLLKHKRSAWVHAFNRLIPCPFQASLFGLPRNITRECLAGFIEVNAKGKRFSKANNFRDWIGKRFGAGIAKHFMIPYNLKFWRTSLENLSYEWTERFIVLPSFKEIVEGAIGRRRKNLGYNSFFWYPQRGGIEQLIKAFSAKLKNIFLDCQASEINLKDKTLKFKNGCREKFSLLISTIPLPELAKVIKGIPKNILSEFKKLKWLSIYNLNLGLERKLTPLQHWIYFPQQDIPFFRVGFFSNFSPQLAPSGKSSLYSEFSYLENSSPDKEKIALAIKEYLRKLGIIDKDNGVCCENINDIKYAYPIYDRDYKTTREKIIRFLAKNNIITCGRYGSWQYLSMEDVILESQNISKMV